MSRQIAMAASALVAALILGGTALPGRRRPRGGFWRSSAPQERYGGSYGGQAGWLHGVCSEETTSLDHSERHGWLNAREIVAAYLDKDGTLDQAECLTVVEQRFKATHLDNDGTVDASELRSPPDQVLIRLPK